MSAPESMKCSHYVRQMPLERFRLPDDGRKWKQLARSRRGLLLLLSTYANADGTFVRNGINYSPSEKTMAKHGDPRMYYRRTDDLQRLGLLSWTRDRHYGRRVFTIQLSATPESPVRFDEKHLSGSQEHLSPCQVITPVTSTNYPSYPNTSAIFDDRDCPDSPLEPPTSAVNDTDAAAANDQPSASDILFFSSNPKGTSPSSQPNPLDGRNGTEETNFALEEQHSDPIDAETRRRLRQSYAIEKATEFRALPQELRDAVNRLRQICRQVWEFENTDIDVTFPSPKKNHQLNLAEMLVTYSESQIVDAWRKFVNRPQGFGGLGAIWGNFFLEFHDYVEIETGAHRG